MVARFSGLNLCKLKQTLTKVHHSGGKCGLVETLLSKVENFTLGATYEFNLFFNFYSLFDSDNFSKANNIQYSIRTKINIHSYTGS